MTPQTNARENGRHKLSYELADYGISTLLEKKLAAFHLKGYEDASQYGGHPNVLKINLDKIREETVLEVTLPNSRQKERINKLEAEIVCLNENNESLEADITRIESQQIPMFRKSIEEITLDKERDLAENARRIEQLKEEKNVIKRGEGIPGNGQMRAGERMGLYLGLVIEVFLTLFLILFYSSVVFSAFMLDVNNAILADIQNGRLFSTTIINLQSFSKSFAAAGISGPVFLLSSAFMFLGLGYLIYQFGKVKAYLKAAALFTFTFLFDALLAYEIVRKIHIANFNAGTVAEAWQFNTAFHEFSFWAILCAGFVMYIIWGLILSFSINEFNQLKPLISMLNENAEKIKACEKTAEEIRRRAGEKIATKKETVEQLEAKVLEIGEKIRTNENKKMEFQQQITTIRNTREINTHLLLSKAKAYALGWLQFLSGVYSGSDSESKVNTCSVQLSTFLTECRALEVKSIRSIQS